MKILLLLANCNKSMFRQCVEHTKQVLTELDIEVEAFDLTQLPYFEGKIVSESTRLVTILEDCKGIIACSNIHIGGVHGAMQSFFDHMILQNEHIKGQPMFAMTYSDWIGEVKGANDMLGAWETLGGVDGGKICLNQQVVFEDVEVSLERSIETFYRMIKQERPQIMSNDRRVFIENFKTVQEEDIVCHVDLSTEEQNIKELTELLKGQMSRKEPTEFVQYNTGTYQKPTLEANRIPTKKLQNLPHYFVATHDKELAVSIQFTLTDTGEQGAIIIEDGDCEYREGILDSATLEIVATDKILTSILAQEMTYQKAFMLGRIKVKGNFIFLSKIDQVFKAM
ncbi:MAG: NAD(P)H-dependent oxidoreductase [Cellulosilyticaceae bacterium]